MQVVELEHLMQYQVQLLAVLVVVVMEQYIPQAVKEQMGLIIPEEVVVDLVDPLLEQLLEHLEEVV